MCFTARQGLRVRYRKPAHAHPDVRHQEPVPIEPTSAPTSETPSISVARIPTLPRRGTMTKWGMFDQNQIPGQDRRKGFEPDCDNFERDGTVISTGPAPAA